MRKFIVLAVLLGATPAPASGGFWCSAEESGASFDVQAGVTRGMGSPVFSLKGELKIADHSIGTDLREAAFEREHLAQYWLDGKDLRLLLYRERQGEGFGAVEIEIRAERMADDESAYAGRFSIRVDDQTARPDRPLTLAGAVSCSVE